MKKTITLMVLLFGLFLALWGSSFLTSHPLVLFLLKGHGDSLAAFKMNAYLSGQASKVEVISLTTEQKKQAEKILEEKKLGDLEAFSKNFGSFSAVIGMPTTQDGWPDYLGQGTQRIKAEMAQDVFDTLQWADRAYLAFAIPAPPLASLPATEAASPVPGPSVSLSPLATIPGFEKTTGAVRVEILNGCGITNAASWVAHRMMGQGITLIGSGNADSFKYPKTLVRVSGEMAPVLEEALGRLGLSKDSVQAMPTPLPNADVVVIVGRDFRKLKRHRHD